VSDLSPADEALLDEAARRLVAARMALPAMMALEMLTPANLVTATMLHGLQPLLGMVLPAARVAQVAQLLERRETIPDFVRRIDAAEEQRRRAAATPR
jgi:hypothetical protein